MKSETLQKIMEQSMKQGIHIDLSGNLPLNKDDITILEKAQDQNGCIHPKVEVSREKRIIYSEPNILTIPHGGFSKAVQPIDDKHILATVHMDISNAWILMNMLDIRRFKMMVQNNNNLYDEIYYDAFERRGTSQEIDDLTVAWSVLCNGGTQAALDNVSNLTIDTKKVNDYFKKIIEIKQWKKKCRIQAENHNHIVYTYFRTKLSANCKHSKDLKGQIMYLWSYGTGRDVLASSVKHFMQEKKLRGLTNDIFIYYIIRNDIVLNISNTLIVNNGIDKVKSDLISMFSCSLPQGWIPPRIDVTI